MKHLDIVQSDLGQARRRLETEGLGMVVVRGGQIVWESRLPGVGGLLEAMAAVSLQDAALADRVIGRAAALVAAHAGVGAVYGAIMSEAGLVALHTAGIAASYGQRVPLIRNRAGTDMCPMEKLTWDIAAPADAVSSLREFTARMRSHPPK